MNNDKLYNDMVAAITAAQFDRLKDAYFKGGVKHDASVICEIAKEVTRQAKVIGSNLRSVA